MDQERERIQADLRGLVDGEVRCDDVAVQLYASDASIYEVRPLAVVRPRHARDVQAAVQYAGEHGLPVHPRGAGSGVAGESLGPGVVLDFSRHMRRLLEIGPDFARVQPGMSLAQLNRLLEPRGRRFAPDPAAAEATTVGGALAVDAAGSRFPACGSARRHVVRLEAVLADGQIIRAEPTQPGEPGAAGRLAGRLAELLKRRRDAVRNAASQTLVRGGYRLDLLARPDGAIDLAQLLVGAEGTLGVITEAVVRTTPSPPRTAVALWFFDRLESAARAALAAVKAGAAACDLMDRRLLSLARESSPAYETLIPPHAEAMLLVEAAAETADELQQTVRRLTGEAARPPGRAFAVRVAADPAQVRLFWGLARNVVPMLYRLQGSKRPLPFVEDIATPPEALPDFLARVQDVLKSHQVTASLFAHAGHGQLHLRPFLDLADPADLRRMHELAADLYRETLRVGGAVGGEHAAGLSRSWFLREQFGPLYDVLREVKQLLDPHNILNPGKVVADVPPPLSHHLRAVAVQQPIEPQLNWTVDEAAREARNCNGCARCRTTSPDERMCPIFRFAYAEEASPRAKANLVRAVLAGRLPGEMLATDALKQVADLCVHCHQCRLECPAGVDIPRLMAECKAQYVAVNGLRPSEWFLARLDIVSSWACRFSPLANWALRNRQARWLLDRLFGVAQGRKLPRVARRSFLRWAHRRRLTRPPRNGPKVAYFVDIYANWYDVALAQAVALVLQHNGVHVYVPPRQAASGMSAYSMGAADHARRLAMRNLPMLADAVRQGYDVVTSEPSAALCLSREYPHLVDDEDARLVASRVSDVCQYLWRRHQQGALQLDFRPIAATAGYHWPCHARALDPQAAGEQLLRLIPGLTVRRMDQGCSGMAGLFGLRRRNYRSSLRAGWGLISSLRDPAIQFGATECSACKMQMEQGMTKPTIHPVKLLALAYGLMPEFASLLTARGEELTVT